MERRERLAALIDGLRQMRPQIDWQSIYPLEDHEGLPPFRGLQAYREEDSHLFFGRDSQVEKLLAHLQESRFLAVVGASGSGKSSLIRAGVIPAVRRGAITINEQNSAGWPIHIIEPGDEPLKALAASLTRDEESVSATATLLKDLTLDPQSLDLFLYRRLTEQPDGRYFLVIDQFEELFTQCDDPETRLQFVKNLVKAVHEGKDGRLSLVIVLRADFYSHAIQLEPLQSLLETNQLIIGAMTAEELRQAIEGPVEAGEWEFQPGLVETIMQDLGAAFGRTPEPGALPLLSLALHETWLRRSGRTLSLAGYQEIGGVQGAITNSAGEIFDALSSDQQRIAQNIFLELVEVDPNIPATRRRVAVDTLAATGEMRQVLNLFAAKRLLTINQNSVEVAHEAIIREWPLLQQWLSQNRDWLQVRREISDAAELWQNENGDPARLYRGSILNRALAQAEHWRSQSGQQLTKFEQSFLDISQQAALAERQREATQRQFRATIFGLSAGGIGFALSFLLTYAAQTTIQSLLLYLTILRLLPGALAGSTFATMYIPPTAGESRPFSRSPFLFNGLVGAVSLGLALLFHSLLRQQALTAGLLAVVEGAVWGFGAGVGIYWIFSTRRPYWQTLPVVILACALLLSLAETVGNAFQAASPLTVFLAGAIVPLALLAAVWFSHRTPKTS
jgi:energy-coupling factor transporter ATP-binding protein EcfA2